jgi:hypothetical protein
MLVKLIFKISMIFMLFIDIGTACRYTVREIGFADFGEDTYKFVLFKDKRISDTNTEIFKRISNAALLDANIAVHVIDVQKEKSSPLLAYYKRSDKGIFPNVLFISPEERVKTFRISNEEDFTQTIWNLIEKIVTSSARNKLLDHIVQSYGVLFFIEGTDSEQNMETRQLVEKAVAEIKLLMMGLSKPVQVPPEIITIKSHEIIEEDILLWSLGWQSLDRSKPALALMYGRCRRMGPLLKGAHLKEEIITNMLRFIGADCECGLDKSWMLGKMIPLRWDSKLKAAVFEQYGFDADNPMVVSEMSQILSIAPERVNRSVDTDVLYGYSESVQRISMLANEKDVEQSLVDSDESAFGVKETLIFTVFVFLAIIIVGAIIYFRAKSH